MRRRGVERAVGLDDDHRESVGDDVMQLPRDPLPLGESRQPGILVPLPFKLQRPLALYLVSAPGTLAPGRRGTR